MQVGLVPPEVSSLYEAASHGQRQKQDSGCYMWYAPSISVLKKPAKSFDVKTHRPGPKVIVEERTEFLREKEKGI